MQPIRKLDGDRIMALHGELRDVAVGELCHRRKGGGHAEVVARRVRELIRESIKGRRAT